MRRYDGTNPVAGFVREDLLKTLKVYALHFIKYLSQQKRKNY